MASTTRKGAVRAKSLEDRIVDTAIELAEERGGWDGLPLSRLADELGVSLGEVQGHFRDLDAVADAWFARALKAMLKRQGKSFARLPARERLNKLILIWLDALADHRQVTAKMLLTKMYPPHVHHWVPMIFNLSRTVQWLRDAAGLHRGIPHRQVEEIGLSALFLAVLAVWGSDDTEGQRRTRRFLEKSLAAADRGMAGLFPSRG